MPSSATVRKQRLRKTKAQLIDEIDTLERRAAEKEAQLRVALDNMPGGMALGDLTASGIAGLAAVTAAGLILSPDVFKKGKKARRRLS